MAAGDPITGNQKYFIYALAEDLLVDYETPEDLDRRVEPIYKCRVEEMNRGQAAMLIEDMIAERDDANRPADYPSIFD